MCQKSSSFFLKRSATSRTGDRHNMPRPLQVDLWPFDLESGIRVTCDVGYLYANLSLPRPLCSRLMPDVRERHSQTSDAHHHLMTHTLGAGHNKTKNALASFNLANPVCFTCRKTDRSVNWMNSQTLLLVYGPNYQWYFSWQKSLSLHRYRIFIVVDNFGSFHFWTRRVHAVTDTGLEISKCLLKSDVVKGHGYYWWNGCVTDRKRNRLECPITHAQDHQIVPTADRTKPP